MYAKVIRHKRMIVAAPEQGYAKVGVVVYGEAAERAAFAEFGTRRQPERPFMRATLAENGDAYRARLAALAR